MSVGTMVPETDSSFNKRRARGATQIYRPPPARNTKVSDGAGNAFYEEQLHKQQQYLSALKHYQSVDQNNYSHVGTNEKGSSPSATDFDRQRSRRPDQQFYVPRRRRLPDDSTPCSTPTPYEEPPPRAPSPTNSICSVVSEFSGRNRYNKYGSRSNRYPGYQDDDRVQGKPPMSFSKESPYVEKSRYKPSLFASETLQLIERCINHDPSKTLNSTPEHHSSSNKYNREKGGGQRGLNSSWDNHPVHSKENLMHPFESNQRSRKGKRNRKRGSKSRDQSLEHKGNNNYNRSSVSNENLVRTFYNSNTNTYERCGYDRMNSRNSSRASSRNPSVERTPFDNQPGYEWRVKGYSTPTSPVKTSTPILDKTYRRHSLGKPPIGRNMYNVHVDPVPTSSCHYSNEPSPTSVSQPICKSKDNCAEEAVQPSCSNICEKTPDEIIPNDKEVALQITVDMKDDVNQRELVVDSKVEYTRVVSQADKRENGTISASTTTNYTSTATSPTCKLLEEIDNTCDTSDYSSATEDCSLSMIANISNISDTSNSNVLPPSIEDSYSCTSDKSTNDAEIIESSTSTNKDCLPATLTLETLSEGNDNAFLSSTRLAETIGCNDSQDVSKSLNVTQESENILEISGDDENESKKGKNSPLKQEESNPRIFSFNWADEVCQGGEDSWDNLYDDGGNFLHSSVKRDLEDSIGKIKLEKPSCDYYEFEPARESQMTDEELGNIIEIYDFPASFQTQDLLTVFQEFKSFDLRWVDDTHALGIFATSLLAADSLNLAHPFVKTRPLSKGIEASRTKAIRFAERLPFKPRPETSVALARRLVTGALGLKVEVSKEQRDAERQKLRKAKEKKRLIAKQREDAWEGTF